MKDEIRYDIVDTPGQEARPWLTEEVAFSDGEILNYLMDMWFS